MYTYLQKSLSILLAVGLLLGLCVTAWAEDKGTVIIVDTNGNGVIEESEVSHIMVAAGIGPKRHTYKVVIQKSDDGADVTAIGNNAFTGYTGMQSVTLPSTLQSIGQSAFSGCNNLESITIPANVTQIGARAFLSCGGLKTITFKRITPPTFGRSIFLGVEDCKVIVPSAAENLYTPSVLESLGLIRYEYSATGDGEEGSTYILPLAPEPEVNYYQNPIRIDVRDETVVSASVFRTIQEQYPDHTVEVYGWEYTFTFKPGSLRVPDDAISYDFGLTINGSDNKHELRALSGDSHAFVLSFKHNGSFPGTAQLVVDLGRGQRHKVYDYFYYNPKLNALELKQTIVTDGLGDATLIQDRASDYLLVHSTKTPGSVTTIGVGTGTGELTAAQLNPETGW